VPRKFEGKGEQAGPANTFRTADGLWHWEGPGGPVFWGTKDGRVWLIEHMETTHIRRCIANILCGIIKGRGAYMPLLIEELKRRKETDHVPDPHEQHEPDAVRHSDSDPASG
jgi:hypothetical protein